MPRFMTLQRIEEVPHGVALLVPVPAGTYTTVSDDEAIILRALPRDFTEIVEWDGKTQVDRMITKATVTKGVEGEADTAADCEA